MFITSNFGPAYKYRLEIMKQASPHTKEFVYVLTDAISYEKFYRDLEEHFTFLIVDEFRSGYKLSVDNEIIPNMFFNEEDHFTNFESYYKSLDNNFSFDIHRFALPILANLGLTKFFIIDSDVIVTQEREDLVNYFNSLPDKSFFSPFMGYDSVNLENKQKFWKELKYSQITDRYTVSNEVALFDGWGRGFNFENVNDMLEFFNIWNTSYLDVISKRKNENNAILLDTNGEGPLIWSNEWIFSHCIDMFVTIKKYNYFSEYCFQPGIFEFKKDEVLKKIAVHCPRPEDNLYFSFNGKRGAWYDFTFNYNNQKKIKDFIRDNKEELYRYYTSSGKFSNVEITDTHVYTKI